MPALQQLVRGYRSCQMMSHMQTPPAHALRCLPGVAAVVGQSSQQGSLCRSCRACAATSSPAGGEHSLHSSSRSSGKQCPSIQQAQQHWGCSTGISKRPSTAAQLVCYASSQPQDSTPQPSGGSTVLTLPTILTLGRVAAIPALIAVWFWQDPAASTVVTALFVAAAITDWLDGYLARKMNASTPFGAFLDPVADKLMVAAVLILLSTQPLAAGPFAGNTWFVPVATLVIIGREISMSALREWAATLGPAAKAAVAVNAWGKWKTATQMVSLTCLLLTKDGAVGQLGAVAAAAGPPLLAVAAWLTAHSLALYVVGLWKFMK